MTEAMQARVLLCVLALAGCGGEQFAMAGEGGGGNKGGSGGKVLPGDTTGGTSVVPGPGGSTGGSMGMVGPGDVVEPEPADGGEPGTGRGEAGAGSVEPGDPGDDPPETLDLIECGPDAFGVGIVPTLYSTLDSALAITEPAIGELGFVVNGIDDYHGEHCGGTSINVDQTGDYVKYHYQDNGVQHYSPLVGAMDFWYRPAYAHTDGFDHHLFSSANWASAGGFRLRKASADNANTFQVVVASSTLQVLEIAVPADEYALNPGVWSRITVIWYLAPDMPQRFVRLYIDGTLAGAVVPESSFQMAPDEGGFFIFGGWDFGDAQHAYGWLDELKIFGRGP